MYTLKNRAGRTVAFAFPITEREGIFHKTSLTDGSERAFNQNRRRFPQATIHTEEGLMVVLHGASNGEFCDSFPGKSARFIVRCYPAQGKRLYPKLARKIVGDWEGKTLSIARELGGYWFYIVRSSRVSRHLLADWYLELHRQAALKEAQGWLEQFMDREVKSVGLFLARQTRACKVPDILLLPPRYFISRQDKAREKFLQQVLDEGVKRGLWVGRKSQAKAGGMIYKLTPIGEQQFSASVWRRMPKAQPR